MTWAERLRLPLVLGYMRLTPFDLATAEGRAHERHRRLVLTSLSGMTAKLISVATLLVSIPLTLGYLGPERYGIWMTLASMVTMLAFADLGIGKGLVNVVAAAMGASNIPLLRAYVGNAYAALTVIAAVLATSFLILAPSVDWADWFNLTGDVARAELYPSLLAFILCACVAIPALVVIRVQNGMQMGFLANLWQISSSILTLGALFLAISQRASLPVLVVAFAGTPVLVNACNTFVFFFMRPDLRPDFSAIDREKTGEIMRTGLFFFVHSITLALTYTSDNLLIIRLLGPEKVAAYSVQEKLFSVIPILMGIVVLPLWPAIRESYARDDIAWIRKAFTRAIGGTLIVTILLSFALILVAPPVIRIWVDGAVKAAPMLLLSLGLWKVIEATGTTNATLLSGMNQFKPQIFFAIGYMTLTLPLKFYLINSIGAAGAPLANSISYGITTVIPGLIFVRLVVWRRILRTKSVAGIG